jgi:O-antigen ligase
LLPLGASDAQRMFIWQSAFNNLKWLGWGPGVFFSIALPYDSGVIYPGHVHNDALQLAFEYGIGAALPIGVIGWALFRPRAKEWPVVLAFVTASCYSMPLWMPVASFLALVAVGRVLRNDALAIDSSDGSRHHVVQGLRQAGGEAVSVASYH